MSSFNGRTLVLCFDGTTNLYDFDNTNIIKFFDLLRKDDPDRQMVYYQPGIGTYVNPGMWMPIVVQMSKLADQAFAWFLDSHIMGGYKFLMQNWRKGDRICLFGFSRGAYTARCLAGMLHKVGLLPSSNQEQVLFAYGMYKDNSKRGWEQAAGFKKTFSRSVEVEFIGVWDTVSAVGVVWPRHLPFSSANTTIKTFRHALSLDERRVRFQPNLWHREAGGEAAAKRDPEHASLGRHFHPVAAVVDEVRELKTDVQEVWFAGCHSDVGGGSVANTTPHSLSFVTLRWMIEQTIRTQTGIMYNPGALRSIGFATTPFIEAHIYTLDKYFYSKGLGINDISKAGDGANEEREVTVSKKGSIEPPKGQEEENLCHRCKMECRAKEREKRHRKVDEKVQPVAEAPEETPGSSSGSSVPSSSRESQDSAPRDSYEREGTLVERTQTRDSTELHRPGTEVLAPKRTFAKRLKSLTTRRKDKPENPLKGKNHPRDATDNVTVAGETDEQRQRHDVLSPVHDELKRMPLWWILEVLPMVKAWQNENGEWERGLQVNFGRPRRIVSTEEPMLHISVKQRMEAGIGYKPRAKMLKGIQRARWTE
ncbi:hypothetical protein FRC04_001483 [Tulasnella sp. 424]|nr:hypothetical protein FRC04_001483 [Tulasnella sp. 424]KAG8974540.1 hypothetical protein FRC05_007172 [Tulasnella sp. 425]